MCLGKFEATFKNAMTFLQIRSRVPACAHEGIGKRGVVKAVRHRGMQNEEITLPFKTSPPLPLGSPCR
jgi:hypothetical protein